MYQKIVSTGFLLHDQKTLIVQRSMGETFLPGYFELPGGKVDFGEDPEEALKREFREEVNLEIKVGSPFKTFSYISENGKRHTVEILFFVHLTDPKKNQVILSSAHIDYKWITKDEVETFPLSTEIKDSIIQGFKMAFCS